jgi:hypothetical protein
MKNAKSVLIGAMVAMSISTYADAINVNNNASHISVEEKKSLSILNNVLPVSMPAIETTAPQKVSVPAVKQPTPEQKAASVELELKNVPKK